MDSNEALFFDPNNLKAIYRRALALNKLGFNSKALSDLQKCIDVDPKNQDAKQLLQTIKKTNSVCFHFL